LTSGKAQRAYLVLCALWLLPHTIEIPLAARAWLDAGLHLWDPKTAGELQAAGISPKIAFRPMKSQGKQTDLTIYRMVSSGQWTSRMRLI
jgi:hypothetical protein